MMKGDRNEMDRFDAMEHKEFTLAGDASAMIDEWGYLSEALGLESYGGDFSTLILSGCGVPCSASYAFTTGSDNQQSLAIKLFRGISDRAAENTHIGDFAIVSIPPSPKGQILIDVAFMITGERQILIGAHVKATGKWLPVRPTSLPAVETSRPPARGTEGRLDFPIGIVTAGDSFSELLPAGTQLPKLFSETFGNAMDNQKSISIELVQRRPEGIEQIAMIIVSDIPPAPKGVLQITVTVTVNRDKELRVKATIPEKGYVREYGPFPVQ
jgi:molecular chaperone DnaK (HSP70)